jgi:hypothetical protein
LRKHFAGLLAVPNVRVEPWSRDQLHSRAHRTKEESSPGGVNGLTS